MSSNMDKYWESMQVEREDGKLFCPRCGKYQKFKGGYAFDGYYGVEGSWWECLECGYSDTTL